MNRFILALIACGLYGGWQVQAQNPRLVKTETLSGPGALQGGIGQARIEEANPNVDAAMLYLADYSYELALLNAKGGLLWQKKVASPWIVVSPGEELLAIVRFEAGHDRYPRDGRIIHKAVEVWDFAGNRQFMLTELGKVHEVKFTPGGDLMVYCSQGLRMYNKRGRQQWSQPAGFHEVKLLGGGTYVEALTYHPQGNSYSVSLLNGGSGSMAKSWEFDNGGDLNVLEVYPGKKQALVSEYQLGQSPHEWRLLIYDTRTWQVESTLATLPAGPFSVAYDEASGRLGVLLRRPMVQSDPKPGEILLGWWVPDSGTWTLQSLGTNKVNFEIDHIAFDPAAGRFKVRLGNTVYHYQ